MIEKIARAISKKHSVKAKGSVSDVMDDVSKKALGEIVGEIEKYSDFSFSPSYSSGRTEVVYEDEDKSTFLVFEFSDFSFSPSYSSGRTEVVYEDEDKSTFLVFEFSDLIEKMREDGETGMIQVFLVFDYDDPGGIWEDIANLEFLVQGDKIKYDVVISPLFKNKVRRIEKLQ